MKDNDVYQKAKKRVQAKFGFFTHLTVYILVNSFLMTMNFVQSQEVIWSVWPLVGWGIGLLFHGLSVLAFPGIENIKEKMIQKEMNKF